LNALIKKKSKTYLVGAWSPSLPALSCCLCAPTLGHFFGRDTANLTLPNPREFSRYVYTVDNPINAVDFTGLFAETAGLYHNSEEEVQPVESTGIATEIVTAVAEAKTRAMLLQNLFKGAVMKRSYSSLLTGALLCLFFAACAPGPNVQATASAAAEAQQQAAPYPPRS
jgi:hypothetical protein